MNLRPERGKWPAALEWSACILATLAAVSLHLIYFTHAGGLWRDETCTVRMATLPSVGEMWNMLGHESFPALFPATVRLWSAIGLGGGDLGLRCLGLGIGLALLAALWLNARAFGSSLPLVSLALLGANLALVRWGDSLRAFGMGCFFILLTLRLVWALMNKPDWKRFLAASLTAVLSVQCLYQNAFLLLAMCTAGCFLSFRCKQEKAGLAALGVGIPAALSLLPYAPIISESQSWWMVEKGGFNAAAAWQSLSGALGSPLGWQTLAWVALCLAALVSGIISLAARERRRRITPEHLPLFAALTLAFSILGFVSFLLMAKLPTQPWYWLPLMVTTAACVEVSLTPWLQRYRAWRLALVVIMVCAPLPAGIKLAKYRQTNIDLIAARLKEQAAPEDFILVYPWFCGPTFNRYYHGGTPWDTIPSLSDRTLQRYDLLKDALAAKAPIKPVLDRIAQTLSAGKRVWIVGEFPPAQPGETQPPDLPPAPGSDWGWSDVPYIYVWGRQADRFIAARAGRTESIPIGSGEEINPYEKASLSVTGGWSLNSGNRPATAP